MKKKTVCLTPGNGHHHVMVIIANGKGYDLEVMAGSLGKSRMATKVACMALVAWWTLLLIIVVGLVKFRWFLLSIGGIGMLQNIYAAGTLRSSSAFNVSMKPYANFPTIIGYRLTVKKVDSNDSDESEPAPEAWSENTSN
jgi:hypothetical protein